MVRKASIFQNAEPFQTFQQKVKRSKGSLNKAISGLLLTIFAIIFMAVDPVPHFIKYYTKLTNGSYSFKMMQKPPITAFASFYIFNVTNSEEFLSGVDKKLKVKEIGPYVYQEIRENFNLTLHDNGTLTMKPTIKLVYIPEKSKGDIENDFVIAPNVPMLAVSSMVADEGFFTNLALSTLVSTLGEKEFLKLKAKDYLWGYDSKLVEMASTIMPGWITFDKFGLLSEAYKDVDDVVTIKVDEGKDQYSIQYWNGSPKLKEYDVTDSDSNDTCTDVKGSYEGLIFPSDITKQDTFKIYRKTNCRTVKMVFEKETKTANGVAAYKFSFPNNVFDCTNEENKCFCTKNYKYFPHGLTDVSPCYFDVPVASSLPHFYSWDPETVQKIEGLNPTKELHDPFMLMLPDLGLPLQLKSRLQGNLVMQEITYNGPAKKFGKMVIPLFWCDLAVDNLPPVLNWFVQIFYIYFPIIKPIVLSLVFILGIVVMAVNSIPLIKPSAFLRTVRLSMEYNPIPADEEPETKKYVHDNPMMDTFENVML